MQEENLSECNEKKILIRLKSRKWVYFPFPVVFSFLRDALFRVSSSWRNFISYESYVWPFSFFMKANDIFSLIFFLFLVRNDRNWSSLRCITLNARVYSLTLVFTSTGIGKTPPISLTYPKCLLKTSSEEWSMILHMTSENFVNLKYNGWKETARNLTLIIFVCHMVILNISKSATVVEI